MKDYRNTSGKVLVIRASLRKYVCLYKIEQIVRFIESCNRFVSRGCLLKIQHVLQPYYDTIRVGIIHGMEKCCFNFETGYFRKCKLKVAGCFRYYQQVGKFIVRVFILRVQYYSVIKSDSIYQRSFSREKLLSLLGQLFLDVPSLNVL